MYHCLWISDTPKFMFNINNIQDRDMTRKL